MKVYRLSKSEYSDELTGTGAALFGGRWNPKGFPMIYTASSISLTILEFMAHNFHLMPSLNLTLCVIQLPDELSIESIEKEYLPKHWNKPLQSQKFTQGIGVEFLKAKRAYALKVPSALVPQEFKLLLNPNHPLHQSTQIMDQISPFRLDERIFGLSEDKD